MLCKDFHGYLVYSNGRIYSNKTNKFLKFDCYGSYAQVTLSIDKKPVRYKIHRLIAYLFCNPPLNYNELETNEYMMSELVSLKGKSLTWVYNKIIEFLDGKIIKEFEENGIVFIKDLKK